MRKKKKSFASHKARIIVFVFLSKYILFVTLFHNVYDIQINYSITSKNLRIIYQISLKIKVAKYKKMFVQGKERFKEI